MVYCPILLKVAETAEVLSPIVATGPKAPEGVTVVFVNVEVEDVNVDVEDVKDPVAELTY